MLDTATIPFEDINAAALAAYPGLLAEWFPAGRLAGHEFQLGDLSGKPGESLSINVSTGKWADFASDAKGGDPISLFAAAFHAGDRVQAARELGQRFGVLGTPAPRPAVPPPAAPAGEDWVPQVPPPPGTLEAPLKGWDHVYAYRDADGAVLRYVVRRDARAGATGAAKRKQILPLTYGVLNGKPGWHHKHAAAPRHLYGLDRLTRPKAVIVCEGEKAADAAHRMLPDNPCLTWSAGSNAVRLTDWSPLAERVVVIWPDADAPGLKAAAEIADALRGIAKKLLFVDTSGLADGFDAADLETPDPAGWLMDRVRQEMPGTVAEASVEITPAPPRPAPAARRSRPAAQSRALTVVMTGARPLIRIIAGELPRVVDDAEAALLKGNAPLYQRGGLIVRPVFEEVKGASGHSFRAPQLVTASEPNVAEWMGLTANFEKFDGRSHDFVPCDCPEKVAQTYLARRGAWRLRRLAGIIDAPTLRADGSILDAPGYDEATGLLFEPHGVEFPPIPSEPTQAEAADALKVLTDLVSTFPFVADADRSVALSAILTALIRRSLPTAPLHGFSAPTAGSGKSLLVDIAALVATGRRVPVIAQGKTEEEAEKRLGAALMAGDAVISIDNCERPLGGDFLCQALTQPMVKTRVLGQSINVEVPSNAAVFATGNNLTFMGDMTRRVLLCSLDPQMERPELRAFEANPLDMIETDRGRYVVAGLTVLRAYHVAGRPPQAAPLGSFTEWSRWVRDALLWLDEKDPAETMEKVRAADPKLEALATVMDQWSTVIGSTRVSAREVIEIAASDTTETTPPYRRAFVYADFREALLVVAGDGGAINSKRLGKWLSAHADRIVGGRKLMAEHGHNNTARWRLIQIIDRE
ncbi:hypothetical protein [Azospirillum argentinense]